MINYSYEEAKQFRNDYLYTEHLLLTLIRDGITVESAVLAHFGLELERTRQEVISMLKE